MLGEQRARLRGRRLAYLFVRKPELVLQDGLVVNQRLHLIGKSVERLGQSLRQLDVAHHIDGMWSVEIEQSKRLISW